MTTRACQCCGGDLPGRDVWEANRDRAGECTGSVGDKGRCRAYEADDLWEDEAALLVCGAQVQVDRSGVGHCWVDVAAADLPGNVQEEIEGEMIDGRKEECEDFVASNGLHYRW